MNKNSNTYTFIYASVMVILVAAALAFVNGALKEKQKKNVEIDKKLQILSSVIPNPVYSEAEAKYNEIITAAYIVDGSGEKISEDASEAFAVDMAAAGHPLVVFEAQVDGARKYIIPLYGAGLWGPIWGYISLNDDANTVYSASFSHQGETPGLGAEIATEKFQKPFAGKQIFKNGEFRSLAVLKAGAKADNQDAVDAITGGTCTSRGVEEMLKSCLGAYEPFFKNVQAEKAAAAVAEEAVCQENCE